MIELIVLLSTLQSRCELFTKFSNLIFVSFSCTSNKYQDSFPIISLLFGQVYFLPLIVLCYYFGVLGDDLNSLA